MANHINIVACCDHFNIELINIELIEEFGSIIVLDRNEQEKRHFSF